jgi:hypothetical protein
MSCIIQAGYGPRILQVPSFALIQTLVLCGKQCHLVALPHVHTCDNLTTHPLTCAPETDELAEFLIIVTDSYAIPKHLN